MKQAAFLLALIISAAFAEQNNTFTDPRDGKTYRTVKIDKQTWFAENLQFNAEGSKCYDNKESCDKYGRLYTWNEAMKACPSGWRLPMNTDWDILCKLADSKHKREDNVIGSFCRTAGKYLKAKSGWNDHEGESGNGEDKYGFAALPGGKGDNYGRFHAVGKYGTWWSISSNDVDYAYKWLIGHESDDFYWSTAKKIERHSVRCMRY